MVERKESTVKVMAEEVEVTLDSAGKGSKMTVDWEDGDGQEVEEEVEEVEEGKYSC